MRVDFSKDFEKALDRLSGKLYKSVITAINQVIDATSLEDIQNCKKIESLRNIYRIRIGNQRAFFLLRIEIESDLVMFEYLVSRGEAYAKKNMDRLRKKYM